MCKQILSQLFRTLEAVLNIFIIGYRGTGKTTLGKALAEALDRPFVDTDDLIVEREGKSIPEIFSAVGEGGFRQIEKAVIQSIRRTDAIIACGGGAVLDPENVAALKQNGYCIWLNASASTIAERIQADSNRPALTDLPPIEEIEHLLEVRTPIYQDTADLTFSTDILTINKLLEEVIEHLKGKVI